MPFEDDSWYKKETKPLLKAHYKCLNPGPVRCIIDVHYMLKTGYARITASRKTKEDTLPPFKLPEAALQQAREWREEMAAGDEAEEFARNCEKAAELQEREEARAENKELHGKTHAALANIPTRDEIEQIERRITDAISASSAAKVTRKRAEWPAGQWAWVEAPPGRAAAEAPGGEFFFDRGAKKVVRLEGDILPPENLVRCVQVSLKGTILRNGEEHRVYAVDAETTRVETVRPEAVLKYCWRFSFKEGVALSKAAEKFRRHIGEFVAPLDLDRNATCGQAIFDGAKKGCRVNLLTIEWHKFPDGEDFGHSIEARPAVDSEVPPQVLPAFRNRKKGPAIATSAPPHHFNEADVKTAPFARTAVSVPTTNDRGSNASTKASRETTPKQTIGSGTTEASCQTRPSIYW